VNKAYSELFSDFGDSLLGRKWLDFIPQEKRSSFATIISDIVRRGEEETSVHESIDKAGRIRHQEWKDIPVKNSRGEVVEFHSVGRDITELVNCRNELEQLRRTSAALMDLCPLPALIFDARGKFVEMNHRFEVELMAGNSWRSISDMAEGLPVRKFGRLLARLSEREDLCYSMNAAGRIRLLRGRLIGAGSGELKFLAVFEDMGGQEAKPVLHVRLRNEVVVDGKERPFLIDSDASGKIRASMEALGHRLQVDRIYVFSFDHTDEVFDNVLEWCADGITPHIEDLKGVPMSVYPWWIKRLMKQQWIQVEETSKMPRNARNEMEILQAQGIGALLVAPLVDGDKVVGFAGFDQNDRPRIWHEQELKALQAFKGELEGLLASTLGREQNGDCA
jgi:PAS domain S-box-containing protein